MPRLECLEEHVVYENPKPHVHSRHGYFPGLVRLKSGELIAMFVVAEAFEAPNGTTWISRSIDDGRSWKLQGPLYDKSTVGFETTDCFKPTLLRDGSLIAIGYRFHRHDLESPIALPETRGVLQGDNLVTFSRDGGRRWTAPAILPRSRPELLETSGPGLETESGDLLAVASLFRMPDGSSPSGDIGVLLRSRDRGTTWDDRATFFHTKASHIAPFESRICEMTPGRIVAVVWPYDTNAGRSLANHVVVSHDNGCTWSDPIDTGLRAQASNICWLHGDHLLTIHAHREESPGIFVRLVNFAGDRWKPIEEICLYGAGGRAQVRSGQEFAEIARSIRFGQPSLLKLRGEELLAYYWCVEDGQGRIRAHRLRTALR